MKVSIITPNYNGEDFLDIYFKSLFNERDYIKEIIIVDNGSTDNSTDIIKKYQKDKSVRDRLRDNQALLI